MDKDSVYTLNNGKRCRNDETGELHLQTDETSTDQVSHHVAEHLDVTDLPAELVHAVFRQLVSNINGEPGGEPDFKEPARVKVGPGAPVFLAGVLQSLMRVLLTVPLNILI